MKLTALLLLTLLISYTLSFVVPEEEIKVQKEFLETKSEQTEKPLKKPQHRDFVAWMKTVPPGQYSYLGTGLKLLIQDINSNISQEAADQMAVDLTEASKDFPAFCNTGDEKKDKEEFSAFLSIIGAETSFLPPFPCTKENGCPSCKDCSYNTNGQECETDPKKQYFGRGPLQLSWNTNYSAFSEYINKDKNVFLDNPDLVTASKKMCWASAIWFWNRSHDFGGWCMPQAAWGFFDKCTGECFGGPKNCMDPDCTADHWLELNKGSCHEAIHGKGGMGEVMAIINGGYDCCLTSTYTENYGHTRSRIEWYIDIYFQWTNKFQFEDISAIQLNNCPLAKSVSCTKSPNSTYTHCKFN